MTQLDADAAANISRALAGKLDLFSIVGSTWTAVMALIKSEGASILLIDPETRRMRFYVAEGPGSEKARTVPVPPGAGICGHVARTGRSLIVNDAQHDPRLYRAVDKASGTITRNILCVPIRSAARLWGVLELINKRAGLDFDQRDLRLAQVAAAQTGLALENAYLHTKIVRQERMAAIGRTVSGLAHCIKNILNGIRAGSAVIDRSLARQDLAEINRGWQTVRRNNDMLGNLVLDMLALARESKPHLFPSDVNDLADQVCGLLTEQASARGVRITCRTAEAMPDVMVDPTHIYRCLLNLASNAVDACPEGGRVQVSVYRSAARRRFTISIRDNGTGISAAHQRQLFQEFFSTKGGRGTGLGLPVTKKLIEQLGGTIKFHSVPGHGTRFVIALPLRTAAAHAEQEPHS